MNIPFSLKGRVALVTGASRGIGRAVALELARAGARVGIHYLEREAAAGEVLRAINEMLECAARCAETARTGPGTADPAVAAPGSPAAAPLQADLRDPAAARRLGVACAGILGPVDIVVHNAGIWNGMPIEAADEARLEEMLGLNLKALFHLNAAVVPGMKARGWGRLISISSTAGLLGEPEHAHYAAAKGGLEMLTRSLAVELGPFGITANSVAPGWTLTEMTRADLDEARKAAIAGEIPTRRIAAPEDVAHAVRFLASEEARHVNGVCLPVEGGYRWRR